MNALTAIVPILAIALALLAHKGEGSTDTVPAYFYRYNYHSQHHRRLHAEGTAKKKPEKPLAFDNGLYNAASENGSGDGERQKTGGSDDSGSSSSGSDNEEHGSEGYGNEGYGSEGQVTTGGWDFGGGATTVWRCVNPDDVALTHYTSAILDLLDAHSIPATFFVLGVNMTEEHAAVLRRIAASHTIASHSWGHDNYLYLSDDQIDHDLRRTSEAIQRMTGVYPAFFRAPYGVHNAIVKHGMKPIMWNIDSSDWRHVASGAGPGHSLGIIKSVLPHAPGAIILQHDIFNYSVHEQEGIFRAIQSSGKRFVSMERCVHG